MDKTETIKTDLYDIEGSDKVRISDNTIEALAPGTVQVFVKHTFNMLGTEWNVVAEPIRINITK